MAVACLTRGMFNLSRSLRTVDRRRLKSAECLVKALCSATSSCGEPGGVKLRFMDQQVQQILKSISGLDLNKVFKAVKGELKPPTYKLMTDEQLQQARETAAGQARTKLRMPPVLSQRTPINDVLAEDKVLDGLETAKYIFTDITYETPHRERFVVVREPDGTLRKATWEERDRMLQVYFPKPGRKLVPPPIFQEANLKVVYQQDRHGDLLDLCVAQFEPDSAEYIRVHHLTYADVERRGKYDVLRSTRHFGGLVWHLVSARCVDGLLLDMLQKDLVEDAVSLVRLFHMVHPQSASAQAARLQGVKGIDLVQLYGKHESQREGYIQLALQAHQQEQRAS